MKQFGKSAPPRPMLSRGRIWMNGAGAICAARGDIGAVRGDMGMSGDSGRNGMSCGEVTGVSLWCEPSGPKKRVRGDPGISASVWVSVEFLCLLQFYYRQGTRGARKRYTSVQGADFCNCHDGYRYSGRFLSPIFMSSVTEYWEYTH
jgi:hypothetical protein